MGTGIPTLEPAGGVLGPCLISCGIKSRDYLVSYIWLHSIFASLGSLTSINADRHTYAALPFKMASRKRPANFNDASFQDQHAKQARVASYHVSRTEQAPGSSQAQPFVILDEEEDEDGSQEVPDSSQGGYGNRYELYASGVTDGTLILARRAHSCPDHLEGSQLHDVVFVLLGACAISTLPALSCFEHTGSSASPELQCSARTPFNPGLVSHCNNLS
ncbi:hypothetical protein P154DRAFT_264835 [Amniculicola lignicola CBS 123094]|uniref:Uncharacterized protein n=1 Tax=Amniculicola lignicola CBS 123094 TaxID=1392246 RepID=A0A6A5W7T5_9PLEO|nr:hypothetical protein P154DRAFT_264835 [Amniculicola lignicola CBS 123094]